MALTGEACSKVIAPRLTVFCIDWTYVEKLKCNCCLSNNNKKKNGTDKQEEHFCDMQQKLNLSAFVFC